MYSHIHTCTANYQVLSHALFGKPARGVRVRMESLNKNNAMHTCPTTRVPIQLSILPTRIHTLALQIASAYRMFSMSASRRQFHRKAFQ